MPEFNEKNLEKAARQLSTKLLLHRILTVTNTKPNTVAYPKLMPPHMRPHTWVFLRQTGMTPPAIALGVIFHTWPRKKFNMVRFTAHTPSGEVKTSGCLTPLDNGEVGLILDVRWPWKTLLKKYKGLSAGNL